VGTSLDVAVVVENDIGIVGIWKAHDDEDGKDLDTERAVRREKTLRQEIITV